jgi:hypothetical protein
MTALSADTRKTNMTTFTIDTDNNIRAHGTPEEAAAESSPNHPFQCQRIPHRIPATVVVKVHEPTSHQLTRSLLYNQIRLADPEERAL